MSRNFSGLRDGGMGRASAQLVSQEHTPRGWVLDARKKKRKDFRRGNQWDIDRDLRPALALRTKARLVRDALDAAERESTGETRALPLRAMSSSEGPDPQLLKRIALGDEQAFGALYDALAPRLFGLICAILPDAAEAEDVLQECFVHVWRNAQRYDPDRGSATAWMFMLCRSRAIDRRRRHQRRAGHVELSGMTESTSPFDLATTVGDDAPAGDGGTVHDALHDLPGEQRDAIQLAFFSGLTHHEIAAQLATPVGTIKARIRRGLMKLAKLLADPT